jgi:2-polyprenyl-6-methoxyphenol hydroxylase-like FAD-dependent oxidoreductase
VGKGAFDRQRTFRIRLTPPFIKLHLGPFSKRLAPLGTRHSPTADRPYPNMLMVPQWRTNEILHDRFAELGGRIEYDSALLGIAQTEAVVTAELATGETIKADYLVGCDGGRSTVRGLLGVQLVGTSLDNKTMVVADLEIESLDREFWHAWPLNFGGMPSLCPLPLGNLFQLQSTSRIARSGLEAGVLRATGQRVTGIAWQSEFRHQTRMVDRYRVGRAFLAGDAAHLHPPSGAQGLNTSVQDAWNLGWKLAAAIRTGDDGLLETYQQERLPIAAAMLDLTGALHLRSSLKRGELTNHLSLGYRESTLNVGEADDGLAPGDRIPDRLLPDGSRLFRSSASHRGDPADPSQRAAYPYPARCLCCRDRSSGGWQLLRRRGAQSRDRLIVTTTDHTHTHHEHIQALHPVECAKPPRTNRQKLAGSVWENGFQISDLTRFQIALYRRQAQAAIYHLPCSYITPPAGGIGGAEIGLGTNRP